MRGGQLSRVTTPQMLNKRILPVVPNCNILYASGYVEESVEQAIAFLQQVGVRVTFLGLKSGVVFSASGTSLSPSVLISQFNGDEIDWLLPDSLLVAGGSACGQQLLADPRVHSLIQRMSLRAKPVGFLSPISYSLVERLQQSDFPTSFLLQEKPEDTLFLQRFVQTALPPTTSGKGQDDPHHKQ